MEYGPSDSSGTDDDLPPSHQNQNQNRSARGNFIGNGRSASAALSYPRAQNDFETQIHIIEQEAYSSVLRAFKAQSDAITWEKESLITELRKELRVSDDEHRQLLSKVNADDMIRRIREWRQAGGGQSGIINNAQPVHDSIPSPTISQSRKRPKQSQSIPSHSMNAPSPVLHAQQVTAPSSSAAIRGASLGPKSKKPKPPMTGVTPMKSLQMPSTGPSGKTQVTHRNPSVPTGPPQYNSLIGKKVWTRWPEDNSFYEAVITDYNAHEGRHALVYDINTKNETWEWVNLKEIPPEDIRWEGEDPGIKKPTGQSGARGRGPMKNQSTKVLATNGLGKKRVGDFQILHTDSLLREVENIFSASHPDPFEVEKAKKMLKEHEQSLIDAITTLADISDGESGEN